MVLSSGYGQCELHKWSRQAVAQQTMTGTASLAPKSPINVYISSYGNAATLRDIPKIPNPSLFEFERPENDNIGLPTVGECAAHLELLQTFHHLFIKVSSSASLDAVLGIKAEPRTVYRKTYKGYRKGYSTEAVKLRDTTLYDRRKTKWNFYLALAATRFLVWAEAVEEMTDASVGSRAMSLSLPPLDILMVWHALLLNSTWFRTFNGRKLERLYETPFPWKAIHEAIDAGNMKSPYNLPAESVHWFEENTLLAPNLFETLEEKDKSIEVQQVLKMHGAPSRSLDGSRGIKVEDVDEALREPSKFNEFETGFLECCRGTIGKNTTVTRLVEAVQRQASFVDKMERQLWIRSPAVEGTLQRAIDRYSKFLKLFKFYPKMMLVPTLDIDLVWHTHQCSPSRYDAGTLKVAGRRINHDDKLGEAVLKPGLTSTKDLYRIRFGQEYQICQCWDCEALLSAVSSHNSETPPDNATIARQVHDEVACFRAVEIIRRRGHAFPKR